MRRTGTADADIEAIRRYVEESSKKVFDEAAVLLKMAKEEHAKELAAKEKNHEFMKHERRYRDEDKIYSKNVAQICEKNEMLVDKYIEQVEGHLETAILTSTKKGSIGGVLERMANSCEVVLNSANTKVGQISSDFDAVKKDVLELKTTMSVVAAKNDLVATNLDKLFQ